METIELICTKNDDVLSTDSHWKKHYSENKIINAPSQFAAFVLNHFDDYTHFIDFGCGDGRDTFFFAKYGKISAGLDMSEAAIALCKTRAAHIDAEALSFSQFDVSDCLEQPLPLQSDFISGNKCVIYARFFLHAINEQAETAFFKFIVEKMNVDSVLCLEFRTDGDRFLKKEFGFHFRRFINLKDFCIKCQTVGFKIEYQIESRGLACHGVEDAMVARLILRKT